MDIKIKLKKKTDVDDNTTKQEGEAIKYYEVITF